MKKYTKAEAEGVFKALRDALENAEARLIEIIENKLWVQLGYVSFAEAWQERLVGIRLTTDYMRAAVVYAMYDEGNSEDEVVEKVGISEQSAKRLRKQRAHGVPASHATTRVRSHERKLPNRPTDFHLTLTADEREQWKDTIEAHGHKPEEWMVRVLRREVRKLERSGVGNHAI